MRQDHVEELREMDREERERRLTAEANAFALHTPRVLSAVEARAISPIAAARQGAVHSARVIADLQATIAAMHEETQ